MRRVRRLLTLHKIGQIEILKDALTETLPFKLSPLMNNLWSLMLTADPSVIDITVPLRKGIIRLDNFMWISPLSQIPFCIKFILPIIDRLDTAYFKRLILNIT